MIPKEARYWIFDLDGTLLTSVGVWNEVDRELIKRMSGREEDMKALQARRDRILAEQVNEKDPYLAYCRMLGETFHYDAPPEEIFRLRYSIAQEFLRERVKYKKGAPELLKWLRESGKTLIIATTTKRANVEIYGNQNRNIREAAELLPLFDRIYTKEDVTRLKPDPEVYLRVQRDFGAAPEECVVFEDSLIGVRAAHAAHLPCYAVYDENSEEDKEEIRALTKEYYRDFLEVLDELK